MHTPNVLPPVYDAYNNPDPMRSIDTAVVLHGALAALPDRQRVLLQSVYMDGIPQSEIASQLPGAPSAEAVKQRMQRARGALLRRLADVGIQSYNDIH